MTTRAINFRSLIVLRLAATISFAAANPQNATLRFLEQRVQGDPSDTVAQNRLSTLCITLMRETGDLTFLDRARQAAEASVAAVPVSQNAGSVAALAVVEFESHHFHQALTLANQACSIDPRLTSALATAGDAQLELGRYVESEKIYAELAHGETTLAPPIAARLAHLAELKGDRDRALALLTQAATAAPDTVWYRVRLGELHFRAGGFAAAESQYEAARKLRPESFLVLEHLGELRAAQGKFDEAISLYQEVAQRAPRGEFFQALGDLYLFAGKPEAAKPWHARALDFYLHSVANGNAHYYHHLAGFYADVQENPAEAVRWARKDLELRQSVYVYDTLAWALYKNGEFAAAVAEAERALAVGTRDPHLLFHAGMILSRAGQLERGATLLKQALAINPRYNSFHAHR